MSWQPRSGRSFGLDETRVTKRVRPLSNVQDPCYVYVLGTSRVLISSLAS